MVRLAITTRMGVPHVRKPIGVALATSLAGVFMLEIAIAQRVTAILLLDCGDFEPELARYNGFVYPRLCVGRSDPIRGLAGPRIGVECGYV